MATVLGISAFYHDAAAAIVRDGEILAAAQEERFTRKKHDDSFPQHAIEYCLSAVGISAAELDAVAFYDKPWLKFERLLETYVAFAPRGFQSFLKAMPIWIKQKLWLEDVMRKELEFEGPIYFPEHHQSHAASAFFPSPFTEAAILTIDGVGEWATTTLGIGNQSGIHITKEIPFPHSLGLLYSAFTYYLGFRVNSGEYKVMGLAPYGEPRYVDKILDNLIDIKEDGSFRLNMKYFNYCQGLTMTNKLFADLFGQPPRAPESKLSTREMDMAASIQRVTEMVMVRLARAAQKETGIRHLVLAGGVALNCVGNGVILRERIYDGIWIQPAAGDAGGALGAALFVTHQVLGIERKVEPDKQRGSLLGPAFSDDEIADWLTEHQYPFQRFSEETLSTEVAALLATGKIVGWLMGRMEYGPRALGGRSILGDPRDPEMQRRMNIKIKFRESFRPFAPACLEEDVLDYFDLEGTSPYMLLVAPVAEKCRKVLPEATAAIEGFDRLKVERSDIPAVTHVDYSARVQTVSADSNKPFYKLLQAFKKQTGCSVLINTSFNVRGEPIVCTPMDAYRCFMRTDIDVLVLGGCVLLKESQPEATKEILAVGPLELD